MPSRSGWLNRPIAVGAALVLVLAAGCQQRAAAPASGKPSRATPNAVPSIAAPAVTVSLWNDTLAGPALFVAGGNPSDAVDVMPHFNDSTLAEAPSTDSALARRPKVDLFARWGQVGTATLEPETDGNFSGSCTAWPTAHVAAPQGPPPEWSVAFTAGHATALPMDSVGALSVQDSSKRAAEVARVASALPNDTAQSFRGLPFAVRDAHRFILPSGDTVIAAELVRHLNEEANPQEEHILLLLERDKAPGPGGGPPPFIPVYSERVSGSEDDVENDEVMAAVMLGRGAHAVPTVVISRDYGDGNSYTLIQRTAPRHWQARWSSAYVGC